jgi:hypothetical protein
MLRLLAIFFPLKTSLALAAPVATSQEADTEVARSKWLATKKALAQSGFTFDPGHFARPPIPDEKNFAKHPLIAELFTKFAIKENSSTRLGEIDIADQYETAIRYEFAFSENSTDRLANGELELKDISVLADPDESPPPPHKIHDYLKESTRIIHRLLIASPPGLPALHPDRLKRLKVFSGNPDPPISEWIHLSMTRTEIGSGELPH